MTEEKSCSTFLQKFRMMSPTAYFLLVGPYFMHFSSINTSAYSKVYPSILIRLKYKLCSLPSGMLKPFLSMGYIVICILLVILI